MDVKFRGSLLLLALAIMVPVAGATYQSPPNSVERWTLAGTGDFTGPLVMFRNIPDTDAPEGGAVNIPAGAVASWISNETAIAPFELGGGDRTFTARLQIRGGSLLQVAVASYDATDQTFRVCGSPRELNVGVVGSVPTVGLIDTTRAELYTVTLQPASCRVEINEALALLVTAVDAPARIGTEDAERLTGASVGRSTLSFSFTPPSWPTPELPSFLLAAGGLGFAGLILVRRSRQI